MERRPDRRRKRTEIGADPQGDSDPHGLFLSTSVAPRIVVDPKPTTTDIGSDVTLTCVWVGNPPLTLTWTKKDSNMVRSLLPLRDAGRKEPGHRLGREGAKEVQHYFSS